MLKYLQLLEVELGIAQLDIPKYLLKPLAVEAVLVAL